MATTELKVVVVPPRPPHQHTHTVVFLHGRGDTAVRFHASLEHSRDSHDRTLAQAFPSFRWVFPRAPTLACANGPGNVAIPQWFDTWDVRNLAHHEDLQADGLKTVVPALRRLLTSEAALLGNVLGREAESSTGDRTGGSTRDSIGDSTGDSTPRWDRIILAGISMGGAAGAHVLFNLDVPDSGGLAAFLAFSSRCPFAGRSLAEMRRILDLDDVPDHDHVVRNTPVLLEHCSDDPLVHISTGYALRNALRQFGADVDWKEYDRGGHWIQSPSGMDDAIAFVKKHVLKEDNEASVPAES